MHSSLSTSTLAGREYDNGALRLVTLLGSGAYGSVYSAHDCHPSVSNPAGKAVLRAVKCIEQRDEERILMEIIYHRSVCEHPNILTIHRTFEDAYTQFIVLDLCPDGDLFSAITQDHLFEGNNALLKAGFLQVVDAVEHCHDHGVFHRDLKPENLLCYDQGSRLVLTDFGLATNVLSSKDFGLGSQQYMSPECVGPGRGRDGEAYSHRKSDIWSLGIILVNMSTALNPWQIASNSDECFNAYRRYPGWLKMNLPISDDSARVVKRVLDINPSTRTNLRKLRRDAERISNFYANDFEEDELPPIPQYNRIEPPLLPEAPSDHCEADRPEVVLTSSFLEIRLLDSLASPVPARDTCSADFVEDESWAIAAPSEDAPLTNISSPSTSLPAAPSIRLVEPPMQPLDVAASEGAPPSAIASSGSFTRHISQITEALQNSSCLPRPKLRPNPPSFTDATWSECTASSSALPTPGEPSLEEMDCYFPAMPLPKGEGYRGVWFGADSEVGKRVQAELVSAAKGSLIHVD